MGEGDGTVAEGGEVRGGCRVGKIVGRSITREEETG
jgi:hypothetical protein